MTKSQKVVCPRLRLRLCHRLRFAFCLRRCLRRPAVPNPSYCWGSGRGEMRLYAQRKKTDSGEQKKSKGHAPLFFNETFRLSNQYVEHSTRTKSETGLISVHQHVPQQCEFWPTNICASHSSPQNERDQLTEIVTGTQGGRGIPCFSAWKNSRHLGRN